MANGLGSRLSRVGMLAWVAVAAVGCNGVAPSSEPTADVPVITPAAGQPASQGWNGVAFTVTPVAYAVQQHVTAQPQPAQDGSYAPVNATPAASTSYLQVMPDRLAFAVTVSNGSPYVYRSMGSVAQLSAGGRPMQAGPADAAGLADLTVMPQTQQTLMVYGPPLSAVAQNTLVTLTLYDVVTATDMAGNPMSRQSYRWSFNYGTQCESLSQLQSYASAQPTNVQPYDQSAGPVYVVTPGSPPPPPRPRPRAVPARAVVPKQAGNGGNGGGAPFKDVKADVVPTTAPATPPPPAKKKKKPAAG